jgi:hypothetical protein
MRLGAAAAALRSFSPRSPSSPGRFHEYFDADGGDGLGADAQAGWTALVANPIVEGWPAD